MSTKRKLTAKVASLTEALTHLEEKLDPLFAQTLPETLVSLDTLQQAKIQVVLPYLINDLIFIYLRTKGIDPKAHPVIAELDRVKKYFDKLKDAEDPAKPRTEIDKAAATRFIKHAIAQAQNGKNLMPNATHTKFDAHGNAIPADAGPSTRAPARVTSKMLEREKYGRELNELGDDTDDGVLQVFDSEAADEAALDARSQSAGKRKAAAVEPPSSTARASRRRRPMDPFGDEGAPEPSPEKMSDTEAEARQLQDLKQKLSADAWDKLCNLAEQLGISVVSTHFFYGTSNPLEDKTGAAPNTQVRRLILSEETQAEATPSTRESSVASSPASDPRRRRKKKAKRHD